jgi:hypothetical protein
MHGLEPVSRVSEHRFGWRIPGKELGLGDALPDDKGILAHAVLVGSTVETMRCNGRRLLSLVACICEANPIDFDSTFLSRNILSPTSANCAIVP